MGVLKTGSVLTVSLYDHLNFSQLSDVGRKRKNNEDNLISLPNYGVFCVADGMGGLEEGEIASKAAVEAMQEEFSKISADDGKYTIQYRAQMVREAMNKASYWIKDRSLQRQKGNTGTTSVVLVFDHQNQSRAVALHAGDSRAYRFRNKKLEQITKDHSVARAIGMDNEKMMPTMLKGVITRGVGLADHVSMELTNVDVAPGDMFLLCSDGLSGMLPDKQLTKLLRQYANCELNVTVKKLIDEANRAGGKDNITAILVRVEGGAAHDAVKETVSESPTSEQGVGALEIIHKEREAQSHAPIEEMPDDPPPVEEAYVDEPPHLAPDEEPSMPDELFEPSSERDALMARSTAFKAVERKPVGDRSFTILAVSLIGLLLLLIGGFVATIKLGYIKLPEKKKPAPDHMENMAELYETLDQEVPLSELLRRVDWDVMDKIHSLQKNGRWGPFRDEMTALTVSDMVFSNVPQAAAIYHAWLTRWEDIADIALKGDAVKKLYTDYEMNAIEQLDKFGVDALPRSDVGWIRKPEEKASLFCALTHKWQKDLSKHYVERVTRCRQLIGLFEPISRIEKMMIFFGKRKDFQKNKSDFVVSLTKLKQKLDKLESWSGLNGDLPIDVHQIRNCPIDVLDDFFVEADANLWIVIRTLIDMSYNQILAWKDEERDDIREEVNTMLKIQDAIEKEYSSYNRDAREWLINVDIERLNTLFEKMMQVIAKISKAKESTM